MKITHKKGLVTLHIPYEDGTVALEMAPATAVGLGQALASAGSAAWTSAFSVPSVPVEAEKIGPDCIGGTDDPSEQL